MKKYLFILVMTLSGCTGALQNPGYPADVAQRQIYECEQMAFQRATPAEKGNPWCIDILRSDCLQRVYGWR